MHYFSFVRLGVFSCLLALAVLPAAGAQDSAAERLHRLFDEAWQFQLQENPLFATRVGDHRFNDRLPRHRLADYQRRQQADQQFLQRLAEIDREELSREDQIHYDIFQWWVEDRLSEYRFQTYLMPITQLSGFHLEFPQLPRYVPLDTVADYENYIARLKAFRQYAADHIGLMRRGVEQRLVLPAVVLDDYQRPIEAQIVEDARQSPFYQPFARLPKRIGPQDAERLEQAGREAIVQSVVPGYRDFLQFMSGQYVPAARGPIAASALPEGRAFYRHRVRRFTTLDKSPEQVHALGQAEVKRIRAEMETLIEKIEFDGDFEAFIQFLRTDGQFYAETPEQLLKEVALVLKAMDGQLPRLFRTLPRMPYGIREIPAYRAPRAPTAYYQAPAGDGTRAGFYYVNTYNLKSRPLYNVEALSLHEAVPGHHLQLALQQELSGLPEFRRFVGITAFVEGWALYAERLGLEVGFYDDPYQDFGRLNFEMWRACRLVIDTGIHYLGWSRQQAIDYLDDHTALARHDIQAEVDRYIAWPGQALAYKTGELKILELRQWAEQQLGAQFDLRAFHDTVLGNGSLTLPVLQEVVRQDVEQRQEDQEPSRDKMP